MQLPPGQPDRRKAVRLERMILSLQSDMMVTARVRIRGSVGLPLSASAGATAGAVGPTAIAVAPAVAIAGAVQPSGFYGSTVTTRSLQITCSSGLPHGEPQNGRGQFTTVTLKLRNEFTLPTFDIRAPGPTIRIASPVRPAQAAGPEPLARSRPTALHPAKPIEHKRTDLLTRASGCLSR